MDQLNALTGGAPKAILFVQKRRITYSGVSKETAVNTNIAALRQVTKAKNTKSIAKRMTKAAGQVTGVDANLAKQAEINKLSNEVATGLASSSFLKFEVQYNPNTLSIRTNAGRHKEYRAMGDSGAMQYAITDRPATTYMDVQLVFEDVNTQDAFVRSNLNLNVNNVKDMAVNAVRKLNNDHPTVKPQVEGLLSLLNMENTRRVVFFWSNMFFHGVLESVDATYNMFNKIGEPIKASVNLTIRQAATGDEYKTDQEYWTKAFDDAFTESPFGGGLTGDIGDLASGFFG